MTEREALLQSIYEENNQDNEGIVILEQTDDSITVYDNCDEKEIVFTMQDAITPEWLAEKIHISESASAILDLSKDFIAQTLLLNLDKEYFTTLNQIFISGNEDDYISVENELDCEDCGIYKKQANSSGKGMEIKSCEINSPYETIGEALENCKTKDKMIQKWLNGNAVKEVGELRNQFFDAINKNDTKTCTNLIGKIADVYSNLHEQFKQYEEREISQEEYEYE